GAIALEHETPRLTYGELNARANQLAHHLRGLGVGPDARVAICVERSIEMLVALLATLKAGGAYVPLDPAYPPERLTYILEDSSPMLLLTHEPARAALAGRTAAIPALNLDSDAAEWGGLSESNPEQVVTGLQARHLAYIIYTSGSTGQPKGVMVEHRGLSNSVCAQIQAFEVESGNRILQFTSFSFDACIFEVTLALCRGASLVLSPRGSVSAGQELIQTINQSGISHVVLPPAVLASLREDVVFDSVRLLIVGGEAVTREVVNRWTPGRRMVNGYGPTETTIWATRYECRVDVPGAPPIGRPIVNTRTYILDPDGRPAPIGVTGEIYIGGTGVSRGYLNRPELTAERFLPDPFSPDLFSEDPGSRMYKTGDLGRWLPDGNIEFLGRNDLQVKIRGFRIELGEIETKLVGLPMVRE